MKRLFAICGLLALLAAPGQTVAQNTDNEATITLADVEAAADKYGIVDLTSAFTLLSLAEGETVSPEDILSRYAQDKAAEPLVAFVNSNSDTFGNVWATREGPDLFFNVSFTEEAPVDEARTLVPAGLNVIFTPGSHSRNQLRAAMDEITAWAAEREASEQVAAPFFGVGNDYPNNGLLIETTDAMGARSALGQWDDLITRINERERPDQVACNSTTDQWGGSRLNCSPKRGGISLVQVSTGAGCTETMQGVNASTLDRVIITAAHCDGGTGTANTYLSHNSVNYYSPATSSGEHDSDIYYGGGRFAWENSPYPSTYQNALYLAIGVMYSVDNVTGDGVGTPGSTPRSITGMGVDDETGSEDGYLTDDYYEYQEFFMGPWVHGALCDCNGSADSGTGLTSGDSGAPIYHTNTSGLHKITGIAIGGNGFYAYAESSAYDSNFAYCMDASCSTYSQDPF